MATPADSPAPAARDIGAPRRDAELASVIESIRRKKGTDLADAAMRSAGDVSKVDGFENLSRCLTQLRALESGYGNGSMGQSLQIAGRALAALQKYKPAFAAAFRPGGAESVRYVYLGLVLGLWGTVSLLCSQGVQFRPAGPSGNLMPHIDQGGAGRVGDSIVSTRLARLVEQAESSGFEAALRAAPQVDSAALGEVALSESWWRQGLTVAAAASTGAIFGAAAALASAAAALILVLLFSARDICAWFYRSRNDTARWLEVQAMFLEMNAAALDPSRRVVREKQEEYVRRLRALADQIRVDAGDAERQAAQDIRAEDRASLPAAAEVAGGAPRLI